MVFLIGIKLSLLWRTGVEASQHAPGQETYGHKSNCIYVPPFFLVLLYFTLCSTTPPLWLASAISMWVMLSAQLVMFSQHECRVGLLRVDRVLLSITLRFGGLNYLAPGARKGEKEELKCCDKEEEEECFLFSLRTHQWWILKHVLLLKP